MKALTSLENLADPVNVLAVDDRPGNRLALRAILGGTGCRVVEAPSGEEALKKLLEGEDYALLLLDVMMPGMGGFELARLVRGRERTAQLPIVFMTAEAGDVELAFKGYRLGAVDYLIKPLVPEIVRAKVGVFAELHRQRKRLEAQAAKLVEGERAAAELKLIELQLAHERRYRSLAEAIPHIVWTADPQGNVDSLNRRWFEYTGLSQATSWLGAVHPAEVERAEATWTTSVRTGRPLQLEVRLRRSDGRYRWHLCRAEPEGGPSGATAAWLGTFTDIEEQKRSQSRLRELKETLDVVADGVFVFDWERWRHLYVNGGAEALLGIQRQELLALRPFSFMASSEGSLRERCEPLCAGREVALTIEGSFERPDGGVVPVELLIQALPGAEECKLVAVARDITWRKKSEVERELLYHEALDAIRTRDEFLMVAAHELKTPLTTLQLHLDDLWRRFEADQVGPLQHKLGATARQVRRLARLSDELVDVTRIGVGRIPLELEEVDLAEVAREAISRYGDDAARASCTLELESQPGVVGHWDRRRLGQVLDSLLSNAIKFGAGRPVQVRVQKGAVAHLEVADEGIGVAASDVQRIFQRFERAVSSREYGGLGLGLFIVHQVVEAHGGAVHVESGPSPGATFAIDLPWHPPGDEPRAHA
jgi:PAS domain S-box-containing protein